MGMKSPRWSKGSPLRAVSPCSVCRRAFSTASSGVSSVPASVAPDLLAHLAAEEFVDGNAESLSFDVPKRDFDAGDCGELDYAASDVEVVVEGLPVLLDAVRVFADEEFAEFVDHCGDGERSSGGFPPSSDAFVGFDLDEDVVSGLAAGG